MRRREPARGRRARRGWKETASPRRSPRRPNRRGAERRCRSSARFDRCEKCFGEFYKNYRRIRKLHVQRTSAAHTASSTPALLTELLASFTDSPVTGPG